MSIYRFDLEFVANGSTHRDEFDFAATDQADAERFTDGVLYAAPVRYYDRTGRLYSPDGALVAEYRERAEA